MAETICELEFLAGSVCGKSAIGFFIYFPLLKSLR